MLGDSVPDKPLLAIWLQLRYETKQSTVIDPQQTANDGKKGPGSEMGEREVTHSETTNLSGEQATMDQVQGSTE